MFFTALDKNCFSQLHLTSFSLGKKLLVFEVGLVGWRFISVVGFHDQVGPDAHRSVELTPVVQINFFEVIVIGIFFILSWIVVQILQLGPLQRIPFVGHQVADFVQANQILSLEYPDRHSQTGPLSKLSVAILLDKEFQGVINLPGTAEVSAGHWHFDVTFNWWSEATFNS